jgi:hypothetical protein
VTDWLALYLALGVLVALIDFVKVAQECALTSFEQLLLCARIVLSWPTYLVEDFLLWRAANED